MLNFQAIFFVSKNLLPLLLIGIFSGCASPKPTVKNQFEALNIAKLELTDICHQHNCSPNDFDAPIKIKDISGGLTKYHWMIRFSKKDIPEVSVIVLVSDYSAFESSFLLQDEYEQRRKEEAKDRKENPWKYN